MKNTFVPAGYWGIHKTIKPDWLKDARVSEIWSFAGCMNGIKIDWINQWTHNGHWHYNSVEDLVSAYKTCGVSEPFEVAYYEIMDQAFDEVAQA